MSKRNIPWSSYDLKGLGDRVFAIVDGLPELDPDSWGWGVTVEVTDDSGHVLGHVRPHGDGWYGFYPAEVPDE